MHTTTSPGRGKYSGGRRLGANARDSGHTPQPLSPVPPRPNTL